LFTPALFNALWCLCTSHEDIANNKLFTKIQNQQHPAHHRHYSNTWNSPSVLTIVGQRCVASTGALKYGGRWRRGRFSRYWRLRRVRRCRSGCISCRGRRLCREVQMRHAVRRYLDVLVAYAPEVRSLNWDPLEAVCLMENGENQQSSMTMLSDKETIFVDKATICWQSNYFLTKQLFVEKSTVCWQSNYLMTMQLFVDVLLLCRLHWCCSHLSSVMRHVCGMNKKDLLNWTELLLP
jgi:hypothetical protein